MLSLTTGSTWMHGVVQPHLLGLAAAKGRNVQDAVMHMGAGGLAWAAAKLGLFVWQCSDRCRHRTHRWRS